MDDLRDLQRLVAGCLTGKTVDLALSVLIAELARVVVAIPQPAQQVRPMLGFIMTQLQEAVAKGRAVSAADGRIE